MNKNSVFQTVGTVKTPRSLFDLSYSVKTTMKMGKLYPIQCDEVVPGDSWKIGNQIVIRFNPLLAPVLHEINAYVHYFFVPYRLLSDDEFDWEKFITGFEETNVDENGELQEYDVPLPRWIPSEGKNAKGTLWDYFGFPVGVDPKGAYPLDFPRRAYNMIWNEFYRDENLMAKVSLDNEDILNRCWEKDYFTSALPFQQRGTSPALPLTGSATVEMPDGSPALIGSLVSPEGGGTVSGSTTSVYKSGTYLEKEFVKLVSNGSGGTAVLSGNDVVLDPSARVNVANLATCDINDVRLAFQVQKWLERNARAGVRYKEFLQAHYNVSPRDDRLQRPEYIGGSKSPIIVSEVVQTSATDENVSAQGNLAGKAFTSTSQYCGHFFVQEFGLIMGIMSVMPRSNYQNGINRQWLRRTRYDFFSPEFQNLSEQAIEEAEIFASDVEAENKKIFGFQGRFDELRTKQNIITGDMRDTFDYWHLGRKFDNAPNLNEDFVKCNPSARIFAEQVEDCMIVEVGNLLRAVRPICYTPEPGLIDHN